jgi:conjugal transfer/entry exclusion protein
MKGLILALCLFLAGCSSIKGDIVGKVADFTGNDLTRTSELAEKYGKPGVKQCSDFMLAQVAKLQSADGQLAALQAESTNGLFSAALKAALIAEALKSLQEANGPQFKAEFKAACSEVAGDILFNVMQDAAKIGSRRF